jgi:hypothetical protein
VLRQQQTGVDDAVRHLSRPIEGFQPNTWWDL